MGPQEKVVPPTSITPATPEQMEPMKLVADPPPQTASEALAALPPPPPGPIVQRGTEKPTSASTPADKREEGQNAVGWATSWKQLLWDKWRWGALIALAVLALSSEARRLRS